MSKETAQTFIKSLPLKSELVKASLQGHLDDQVHLEHGYWPHVKSWLLPHGCIDAQQDPSRSLLTYTARQLMKNQDAINDLNILEQALIDRRYCQWVAPHETRTNFLATWLASSNDCWKPMRLNSFLLSLRHQAFKREFSFLSSGAKIIGYTWLASIAVKGIILGVSEAVAGSLVFGGSVAMGVVAALALVVSIATIIICYKKAKEKDTSSFSSKFSLLEKNGKVAPDQLMVSDASLKSDN